MTITMPRGMTLQERVDAYAAAFPQFPASHFRVVEEQGRLVGYAIWLLGNDYRATSPLYGAYPPRYLDRVLALFPDATRAEEILHAFSGSLPKGPYVRLDLHPSRGADYTGNVCDVARIFTGRPPFRLVFADPPYSAEDALKYETPMVDRRRAMAALAGVTAPGGHLVWLDTVWPMHRKNEWVTVGRLVLDEDPDESLFDPPEALWQQTARIGLIRSTGHRVRLISIFERVAA